MERSEGYVAKHYADAKQERDERAVAGISRMVGAGLDEEARDMRLAGRRLANADDETDLIGAVKKLEELIGEQRESNERIASQMRAMVEEMREVLGKVESLDDKVEERKRAATQMALYGVADAQQKARDMTIESVEKLTAKNEQLIDEMVQESKRRIERIATVTMPDRLLSTGKWVAINLVLILIVHVIWSILA